MSPGLRKFMLTAHVVCSVGWLGAAAAYLTLVIVVLSSSNAQTVQSAILVMEPIDWFVIAPLAFATLIIGTLQSLGTAWGLFRHYWVVFKLVLTLFGVFVLTEYSLTLRHMAAVAGQATLSAADLAYLKDPGHAVHNGGGLLLLLVATVLSVYKPRGLTPYGWHTQRARAASHARA